MRDSFSQSIALNNKSSLFIGLGAIIILMTALISPLIPLAFFVLFILLAIIKNYRIGTMFMIILSFTNFAAQQFSESYHAMLFVTTITIFSFALSYLRGNTTVRGVKDLNLLFIIFGIWAFLSGVLAIDHSLWVENIYWMIRVFVLFYLIHNSFSTKDEIFLLFKIIVLSLFLSCFISFLLLGGTSFKNLLSLFVTRFAGAALDPNYYAMTVAGIIPLAFILTIKEKYLVIKLFWIFTVLFFIFSVIISQSRTGLLSISVVFAYTLFYLIRRKRKEVFIIIIPIVIIIIALPPFVWSRLSLFVNSILTGARGDISMIHRFILLNSAFDVFIKNTVFGVGLGNFQVHCAHYTSHPMIAHNTYLEIASGLGLLGLIPFLLILYRGFNMPGKLISDSNMGELAWGVRAAFLGMFTSLFFLSVPFKLDLWVMLALASIFGKSSNNDSK